MTMTTMTIPLLFCVWWCFDGADDSDHDYDDDDGDGNDDDSDNTTKIMKRRV